MQGDNLMMAARLDAIELLLREMLGFRSPIERMNVVTRVGAMMTAVENEAVLSNDTLRRARAAQQRAALERMTE